VTGREFKALIPDSATIYFSNGDELLEEDVTKDTDGDIFICSPDVDDDEEDEEFEDEDEGIEVDI
jgi:hypothetical protein